VKTKTVQNTFVKLINLFGDEFTFLRHTPIATIEKHLGSLYATALHRLRNHLIDPQPGYDGEYGKIQLLKAKEKQIATQIFFSL
jgi:PHP family Zn ribbon phosphoesterase